MEIIAKESGEHDVLVVRDQPTKRMAVLIMNGTTVIHAEAVGCFGEDETESFIDECRCWLVANHHVAPRRTRSGQFRIELPSGAEGNAGSRSRATA